MVLALYEGYQIREQVIFSVEYVDGLVLVVKQAVVLEGMIDSLIGIGEWCGL
jgi:hypothetical protein